MKAKILFQSMLRALLVIVILGNALMLPNLSASAQPLLDLLANDDFDNASLIDPMPYTDTLDAYLSTTAVDDPSLPCGSRDQGMGSVWYTYTPPSPKLLTLNTFGSDYDTMLAVWTGSRGSLVNIACNDDSGEIDDEGIESLESFLAINVSAGQTYYIEVTGYYFGSLSFHANATGVFMSCALQTEMPEPECDALVALYNGTNGASWNNNSAWLVDESPCDWYGVVCDNNGSMTELSLELNNLSGAIPAELVNLTNLTSLSLENNQLSGSIPSAIGGLTKLSRLSLAGNQLSDPIPPEIGNLTDLTSLSLSDNQLSGPIPPALGNLTQLEYLSLHNNQLSGLIPPEIGNLAQLQYLYLSGNQLSGPIPPEIANPQYLFYLYLDDNLLSGPIPPEIGTLIQLEYLYLNGNQLSGLIPPEIGDMTDLRELSLADNQLDGSIPPELGNLRLRALYLNDNQLSGEFPTSITNLFFLEEFVFDECEGLTSSDPDVIAFINGVIGPGWQCIPIITNLAPYYGPPSGGTSVTISGQDFTGASAVTFGGVSVSFNVDSDMQITTTSPARAAGTVEVIITNSYGEGTGAFTYTLPFSGCANISQISPSECDGLMALYNSTDGAHWSNHAGWLQTDTPCIWYGVSCDAGANMTGLSLTANNLSGLIPPAIGNLAGLTTLALNDNKLLTGPIPTQLGNLSNLMVLLLGGTRLAGEVPVSFLNLINLEDLSISCGLTSTDLPVINFISAFVGGDWELPCLPDDFDDALVIDHFPFTDTRRFTWDYTTAVDDPFFPCGSYDQGLNSAWYTYTPASAGLLTLDTFYASYDTMLAVWTGSRGSLVNVGCNDNANDDSWESQLVIPVSAGQVYYIEVAGYDDYGVFDFNAYMSEISTHTFFSIGAHDGWILESSETSKKGGKLNSKAATFNLGDDATKKQYLAILSFKTGAALPDNAVIMSVMLKVKKQGISGGGNPVNTFQGFMVDIKKGPFGKATLQAADFQARAGKSYGPFKPAPVSGWYSINLSGAKAYVNKLSSGSGLTQMRLRFKRDDNNNAVANILRLFSGNTPVAANRPQLVVTYYVPYVP